YKIERFLDTARVNKNWVLIGKIQNVVATKAFMLRVKNCLVTDSWQKISLRVDTKPEASVSFFSNSSKEQVPISIDKIEVLELCISFVWKGMGNTFKSL
ncbi:34928_t:CDS:2, partial [Gigaspora margarita]